MGSSTVGSCAWLLTMMSWVRAPPPQPTKQIDMEKKICSKCKVEKLITEFHKRPSRKNGSTHSWCKECNLKDTVRRQRLFKKNCIDYKGGRCENCGYNTCPDALEFHHLEPGEKDFSISKSRLTKFDQRVKNELDKCVMLCANCHREEHSKQKHADVV